MWSEYDVIGKAKVSEIRDYIKGLPRETTLYLIETDDGQILLTEMFKNELGKRFPGDLSMSFKDKKK